MQLLVVGAHVAIYFCIYWTPPAGPPWGTSTLEVVDALAGDELQTTWITRTISQELDSDTRLDLVQHDIHLR